MDIPPNENTTPGNGNGEDPLAGIPELPPLTDEGAELLERLADLDGVAYDLQRKAAATELGGIRVGTLDKMVEKIRLDRAAAAAAAAAADQRKQPPPEPPEDTAEVKALIAEFNEIYFVVNENGKPTIYAPKHDPDQNRRFFERIDFADLDKLYLNRTVLTGTTRRPASQSTNASPMSGCTTATAASTSAASCSTRHPASTHRRAQSVARLRVKPRAGSWQLLQ